MGERSSCRAEVDEDGLERLERLLSSRRSAGYPAMSLDTAHGFLTAVLSGPRLVLPVEWMPMIVGGAAVDADGAEAERLLLALQRDVLHELDHGHYGAVVAHRPQLGGAAEPLPYGWCRGYAVGLHLHGEAVLDTAGEDPFAKAHLETIARFLAEDGLDEPGASSGPEQRQRSVAELATAAKALYAWWRGKRPEVPPAP